MSDFCRSRTDVVLVASSSRGGSSVFMETLRHSRSLLHLRGEINPFLVRAGLSWPHSGTGSDRLTADHATPESISDISTAMGQDAGQPAPWPETRPQIERLTDDVMRRFQNQWPTESIEHDLVAKAVAQAVQTHTGSTDPDAIQRFQTEIIAALRERHEGINPWFYDLNPDGVRARFPELAEPQGPPGSAIVEEPPFVLSQPWKTVNDPGLPLVIKTPSNAYRLPFLRALFPNARVRILHLTRNPAASINGLVDGWRFRGFHAHKMSEPLSIAGYADHRPADAQWWKYDLPPDWEAWIDQPLVEVAGFQWRSAHEAILADGAEDSHRVRFEDLVGEPEVRQATYRRLFDWIGVPFDAPLQSIIADGLPPVMATSRPRQRRWFARAEMLEPVLSRADTTAIALALGYDDRSAWI